MCTVQFQKVKSSIKKMSVNNIMLPKTKSNFPSKSKKKRGQILYLRNLEIKLLIKKSL